MDKFIMDKFIWDIKEKEKEENERKAIFPCIFDFNFSSLHLINSNFY